MSDFNIDWSTEIPESNINPATPEEIEELMECIKEKAKKLKPGEIVYLSGRTEVIEAVKEGINNSGSGAAAGTAFFLNTKYMHYRPHAERNMVPLSPNRRYSTNQDAEVQIIGWAGNLTCSGRMFNGRYDANG